ncbi:hypothetical protein K443DRAFT_681494 [Laccaria amethystina LaAM-08-1]|uniref:polynucleotide adenylyltransferase n=1 Tax=Laccaria amethystina LaAM-08-1 TaxID=1095629 RepID=A0A0C9XIT6_9AGAR|nr:hypothetical protein K443DRAFT_681494 [Laccaria amethystina LaAM-08-1]
MRRDLVVRFTALIASFNSGATVRPVGSCVTGLYLPTSDIDMVLTFNNQSKRPYLGTTLASFERKIRVSGFSSQIISVLHASVPLLRITDAITGIDIDLTESDSHAFEATRQVTKWMTATDAQLVKTLVLVVKLFLSIRRCGTTYTGGVNSYLLVWMVIAWVKLDMPTAQVRNVVNGGADALAQAMGALSMNTTAGSAATPVSAGVQSSVTQVDLGAVLIAFFKFWGSNFDYRYKGITFSPRPSYRNKPMNYQQTYLLSICDPANAAVDMGAKAYAIKHVKASFKEAYLILNRMADEKKENPKGTLGTVLGGNFSRFIEKRRMSLSMYTAKQKKVRLV